jgi:hypothetical protein
MSEPSRPEPATDQDARLLEQLGQALGPDPLPAGLVGRAEGLLAYAGLDRDLAELLEEAAAEPAGVRGPVEAGERLVFEVADGSVTVELVVRRDRLDGQVLAGTPTEAVLEWRGGGTAATAVNQLGGFSFEPGAGEPLRSGPARLLLRGGPSRPVTTSWFLL